MALAHNDARHSHITRTGYPTRVRQSVSQNQSVRTMSFDSEIGNTIGTVFGTHDSWHAGVFGCF